MKRLHKLLFFFFPYRDSFGIALNNFPMRIGEMYSCLYLILCWTRKKTYRFGIIDSRLKIIIAALLTNCILSLVISYANAEFIDIGFCHKYLIRNIITLLLIGSIIGTSISYKEKWIVNGMKWNITLQIVTAVIFFVFSQRICMNQFISIWDLQTAEYSGIELPRYSGTSSEAGYLGPLLAMPLFYFLTTFKKNKYLFFITIGLLTISLSTFNYIIIVIAVVYYFFLYDRKKLMQYSLLIGFVSFAAVLLLPIIFKDTLAATVIQANTGKVIGFLTFDLSKTQDWSSMDRTEHLYNAIKFFFSGDFMQILLGHGTGAYSFYALHHSDVTVENVQEAYNIYLSTLTDRGIIGLILFIVIYYNIYKIKTNNTISNAIWFALFIQLVHYFIVGNMWLYYVWQEVLFLIGYEKYLLINKNIKYETQID